MLPCLFKYLTGLDCPGCGLQRSILLLLKGDWKGSLQMYWPTIPILAMFAYCGLFLLFRFPKGARNLIYFFGFNCILIVCHYIYKLSHQL